MSVVRILERVNMRYISKVIQTWMLTTQKRLVFLRVCLFCASLINMLVFLVIVSFPMLFVVGEFGENY